MEAGRLRHKVSVQEKQATRDAFGEERIEWREVQPAWAAIEPLRGREFLEAANHGADITVKITLRVHGEIQLRPAMRVSWERRTFEIVSASEIETRGREWQLLCTEVVG